jgi:hypothetical protein
MSDALQKAWGFYKLPGVTQKELRRFYPLVNESIVDTFSKLPDYDDVRRTKGSFGGKLRSRHEAIVYGGVKLASTKMLNIAMRELREGKTLYEVAKRCGWREERIPSEVLAIAQIRLKLEEKYPKNNAHEKIFADVMHQNYLVRIGEYEETPTELELEPTSVTEPASETVSEPVMEYEPGPMPKLEEPREPLMTREDALDRAHEIVEEQVVLDDVLTSIARITGRFMSKIPDNAPKHIKDAEKIRNHHYKEAMACEEYIDFYYRRLKS